MTTEEFVDFLFQLVLDRPSDEAGRTYWAAQIDAGMPARQVLQAFLESKEFRQRPSDHPILRRQSLRPVSLDLSGWDDSVFPLHIVDVGAQLLEDEDHSYSRLVRSCPCRVTGFEPLSDELEKRRVAEPNVHLLPYFLGDGRDATFFMTRADAASSLYEPNLTLWREFAGLVETESGSIVDNFEVVSTERVSTSRLDDVLPLERIDYLDLDVQGYELNVLRGAPQALQSTLVVYTEVSFEELYTAQPLFSDIDPFLRERGFELIDFVHTERYDYATKHPTGPTSSRMLWGDALYLKRPRLLCENPRDLLAAAFVMHTNFDKRDLCGHLLDLYDEIKGTSLAANYSETVTSV